MIYAVFCITSVGAILLSNRIVLKLGNRTFSCLYVGIIISVFLFSLLTAARDYSVGTDTINYYYSAESILQNYSSLKTVLSDYYIEPVYGVLEYISMKLFGDVHILFLLEGLLLLLGVFSLINNYENNISIAFAFFVFFCFYYNSSLNISRQYLAVAIGFFASKFLIENKAIPYFLLSLLAFSIHASAILLFFSFFIGKIIMPTMTTKSFYLRLFGIMATMALLLIFIKPIVVLMVDYGLLPSKYVGFLQTGDSASSLIMTVIANSPIIVMTALFNKKLIAINSTNKLLIALLYLGFFVSVLNSFFGNVGRLAVYWSSWQIVLYPECCSIIVKEQKEKHKQFLIYLVIIVLLFLYWFYCYIYRGFSETHPYVSNVFEWLNWNY